MSYVLYRSSDSYAAFYIDGHLVAQGDEYNVIEQLLIALGVEDIQSHDFYDAADNTVFTTLDEIEQYKKRVNKIRKAADEMRVEANRLLAEADKLDGDYR